MSPRILSLAVPTVARDLQPRKDAEFSLQARDPQGRPLSAGSKTEDQARISALAVQVDQLQEKLYASRSHAVLLVLQGMDTSGKDGTIREVFNTMDPLGLRVAAFKAPTELERAHHFLWRIHAAAPAKGEICIFNRSHYEDVLITHVHGWIDEAERARRIEAINHFERTLSEHGTVIIKCMLHISAEEQRARLQARLDDPTKHWKFSMGDLEERKLWPAYMQAYDHALRHTSTDWAPWYVIPSDSKTHRNLCVSEILHERLQALNLSYPAAVPAYAGIQVT
jgi:PPK2 family polyphosphate:nucleotide phosphotransferase